MIQGRIDQGVEISNFFSTKLILVLFFSLQNMYLSQPFHHPDFSLGITNLGWCTTLVGTSPVQYFGSKLDGEQKTRLLEAESWFRRAKKIAPTDSSVYYHYGKFSISKNTPSENSHLAITLFRLLKKIQ